MSEFKVGDRIAFRENNGPFLALDARYVIQRIDEEGFLWVGLVDGDNNMMSRCKAQDVALEGTLPPPKTKLEPEPDDPLAPKVADLATAAVTTPKKFPELDRIVAAATEVKERIERIVAPPRAVSFQWRGSEKLVMVPGLAALGILRVDEKIGRVANADAWTSLLQKEGRHASEDQVNKGLLALCIDEIKTLHDVELGSIFKGNSNNNDGAGGRHHRFVLGRHDDAGWIAFHSNPVSFNAKLPLSKSHCFHGYELDKVRLHRVLRDMFRQQCKGRSACGTSRGEAMQQLLSHMSIAGWLSPRLGIGETLDRLSDEIGHLHDNRGACIKSPEGLGMVVVALGRSTEPKLESTSTWIALELSIRGLTALEERVAPPTGKVPPALKKTARAWLEKFLQTPSEADAYPRVDAIAMLPTSVRDALREWKWLSDVDSGSAWPYRVDDRPPFLRVTATTDADDQYHELYDLEGRFILGMHTDEAGKKATWTTTADKVRAIAKKRYAE